LIQITRLLAKRLRAVLRRSVLTGPSKFCRLLVAAGRDGLQVHCATDTVAVAYYQPGALPEDRLVVPVQVLADCEGGKDEPVVLERSRDDSVQARWHDAGVPQRKDYSADSVGVQDFPALPNRWLPQDPALLAALHGASMTAARDGVRYALHCLQLQGKTGQLVATDGKQLLMHSGFRFGWNDSVLIPALPVWGSKELPSNGPIALARTETYIGVRVGPWTFALTIDRQGRFPNVADIVPPPAGRRTTWTLTAPAAALLARALPRLPGGDDREQPVTVDLNQPVAVRARGASEAPITELVLNDSQVSGPAVRFCGNRLYLARALSLGFTRFELVHADKPVVACDNRRTYLWMPLAAKEALPPSNDAVRIGAELANGETVTATEGSEAASRLRVAGTTTNSAGEVSAKRAGEVVPLNGCGPRLTPTPVELSGQRAHQAEPAGMLAGLFQEAEDLRDLLRDGYLRSQRLLAGLKRQRQQTRLLSSTVSALRQLKFVDP
jgi:hypothetical protein